MRRVRHRLFREIFVPALRLFRDTLLTDPDVPRLRDWVAAMERALAQDEPGARIGNVDLGRCSGAWFDIEGADPARTILYLHGGAFVMETPRLHGGFLTRLAKQCRANALMPSYRLAPEHPFPGAHDDSFSAYRWLLAKGADPAKMIVVGDSAGGNLCLSLLQRLRHEGLPLPACAVAMSPLTDGTFSGPSIKRNDGLDPMFTAAGFHRLAPLYLADEAQRAQPLASPLFGELSGMPPILLTVGSSELLLDDSVRFASRCPGTELQVWHDMPHVFPLFEFFPEAVRARADMARFIEASLANAIAPDVQSTIPNQQAEGEAYGAEIQRADR